MRRVWWRAGVPAAALVGTAVGFFSVIVLGLTAPMILVWPLALGVGAALAALAATWVSNVSSPEGSRGLLLAIFLVSEVAAALAVGAAFVLTASTILTPLSIPVALVLVVVGASGAAWRLRGSGSGHLHWDGSAALVLSAAGAALLFALSPGGSWILEGLGLYSPENEFADSSGYGAMVWVSLVVLGLAIAIRRSGTPGEERGKDAGITLGLVGALLPIIQGTVYVGCQAIACGP